MSSDAALDEACTLSQDHPSIFVLAIANNELSVLTKNGDKRDFVVTPDYDRYSFLERRICYYFEFFRFVTLGLPAELKLFFILDIEDIPLGIDTIPIFSFQKKRNSNKILIPDIDFLIDHFYMDTKFTDMVAFGDKATSAVFSGATTGGGITMAGIDAGQFERIKAALYFKNSPSVDFRLPRLVQCDNEETKQYLRSLGFGIGELAWREQFKRKFLLSLDGNGATCSRVAIALRSNSVLLKYDSENILYYFSLMIPWVHFIPIHDDKEVESIVKTEENAQGYFEQIAELGSEFARSTLNRETAIAYTTMLLMLYGSISGDKPVSMPALDEVPISPANLENSVTFCLFPQGLHHIWAWPQAWAGDVGRRRPLSGLSFYPSAEAEMASLRCRLRFSDASETDWFGPGRRVNAPAAAVIVGVAFKFGEHTDRPIALAYEASFVDGTKSGLCRDGEICTGTDMVALEAFRLELCRHGPLDG